MLLHLKMRKLLSKSLADCQFGYLGKPDCSLFFGQGIGDDLLCSTVARELASRGARRIVMFSRHPSLFKNNTDIALVVNWGYASVGRLRLWGYTVHIPQFSTYDKENDVDIFRNEHLLVTMCRMSGIKGSIHLRPYLNLTPQERGYGKISDHQVVIQSAGLGDMLNKDWIVDRYQDVADRLQNTARVIQLGLSSDPQIKGAHDLRGKTTLRQAAAILSNSQVFIGQVGFLMHLARAVDCRSVIVYGGREAPEIVGYSANENMISEMPCAPCWQRNRCEFRRKCMSEIEVDPVYDAALRQIKMFGSPLPVDIGEI